MSVMPKIRAMVHADLDGIQEVEKMSFSIPWTRGMFEDELYNPKAYYTVLEMDGRIIGYLGVWKILDEGHITNVAVHPDYRRRGYGRLLLNSLVESAKEMALTALTLEVRVSNLSAISLYESLGFNRAGVRKRYYSDNNEDALIMWLKL